jgi:hypothetical protein
MEQGKKVEKILTQVVEKFTAAVVGWENDLKTLDQLKTNACNQIAKLKTLVEVENIAISELVDDFTEFLTTEKEELDAKINSICGKLYDWIKKTQDSD